MKLLEMLNVTACTYMLFEQKQTSNAYAPGKHGIGLKLVHNPVNPQYLESPSLHVCKPQQSRPRQAQRLARALRKSLKLEPKTGFPVILHSTAYVVQHLYSPAFLPLTQNLRVSNKKSGFAVDWSKLTRRRMQNLDWRATGCCMTRQSKLLAQLTPIHQQSHQVQELTTHRMTNSNSFSFVDKNYLFTKQ